MLSKNKDWFVYNSYWRTWSRVLLRRGGDSFPYQIEVNLTPANDNKVEWDEIKEVIIRRHCTPAASNDIFTHHLPDDVVQQLEEHFDPDLLEVLLHVDLMKYYDENEHIRHSGRQTLANIIKFPARSFVASHLGVKSSGTQVIDEITFGTIIPKFLEDRFGDQIPMGGILDRQGNIFIAMWCLYSPSEKDYTTHMRITHNHYTYVHDSHYHDIGYGLEQTKTALKEELKEIKTIDPTTLDSFLEFADHIHSVCETENLLKGVINK